MALHVVPGVPVQRARGVRRERALRAAVRRARAGRPLRRVRARALGQPAQRRPLPA